MIKIYIIVQYNQGDDDTLKSRGDCSHKMKSNTW